MKSAPWTRWFVEPSTKPLSVMTNTRTLYSNPGQRSFSWTDLSIDRRERMREKTNMYICQFSTSSIYNEQTNVYIYIIIYAHVDYTIS